MSHENITPFNYFGYWFWDFKIFIPNLYTAFSEEESEYTRKYEGSGIGLALVKNYCNINNAQIEVESEKNVGSTFRVKFNNQN